MEWLGVIAVLIIIILIISKQNKEPQTNEEYPYRKIETLFSPAERSFLGVLNQAIKENTIAFAKVRVADVLLPNKGLSRGDWQKAFNKISAKHFDFLICEKENLSIICAIELDDKSHNSKKSKKRDKFLNNACNAANIPLVRFSAKTSYVINEIKEAIEAKI